MPYAVTILSGAPERGLPLHVHAHLPRAHRPLAAQQQDGQIGAIRGFYFDIFGASSWNVFTK